MKDWRTYKLAMGAFAGAALLVMGAPASAQYYDGPAYSFPVTDMVGPAMAGVSMNSYIDKAKRKGSPRQAPRRAPGPASTAASPANLTVASDPAISQKVKASFRSQLARAYPDKRGAIDQALAKDWLAGYRTDIAAPNRLDPRNLADAVTAYMVAAWAIVHKQEQIPARGIQNARDHFRATMAASAQTRALSASARQQMAEELIYQTVLIMANRVQIARTKDRALADAASRHYRQAVQRGAHIDLQTVRLDDRGFSGN